jgi:hypothetical protein
MPARESAAPIAATLRVSHATVYRVLADDLDPSDLSLRQVVRLAAVAVQPCTAQRHFPPPESSTVGPSPASTRTVHNLLTVVRFIEFFHMLGLAEDCSCKVARFLCRQFALP